jgi:organic hydroperoxide reductase OsmC/OhrA
MLTYPHVASRQGFLIERYVDEAVGVMRRNERGALWVSAVTLRPGIAYGGDQRPSAADEARLHHRAHEQCFIANSVKTEITVKPRDA